MQPAAVITIAIAIEGICFSVPKSTFYTKRFGKEWLQGKRSKV